MSCETGTMFVGFGCRRVSHAIRDTSENRFVQCTFELDNGLLTVHICAYGGTLIVRRIEEARRSYA